MTDKEEHQVITEKLNEILKILNGNGKIGLCAKVELLWKDRGWILASIGTIVISTVLILIRAYIT